MTSVRDRLTFKALTGLYEIAGQCGDRAVGRTFLLRFTLAWLFHAGGARPDRKWVYDDYWKVVTSEPRPLAGMDAYHRQRDATACINGMMHDLGWSTTFETFEAMGRALRGEGGGEGG